MLIILTPLQAGQEACVGFWSMLESGTFLRLPSLLITLAGWKVVKGCLEPSGREKGVNQKTTLNQFGYQLSWHKKLCVAAWMLVRLFARVYEG